jgi:hypothetical protein
MANGLFNIQDVIDDNPFTGVVAPNPRGTSGVIRETSSIQIPSDLLIDTEKQREFFVDFYNQFGDKLGGKGEAVGRWMDVLGQYAVGDAELSDLEAVDVSDLMDIEGFEDYYYGIVPRPLTKDTTDTTTETTTDAASQISDEEAISAVLASVPDKLKGIFTEQNIMKVLEAVMDDPLTKIKKAQGAGVSVEWDRAFPNWRDWRVFGPLAIPGLPLPPGIIDVTLGTIADAVENVGKDIKDGVTSVGDFVQGVLNGDITLKDIYDGVVKKVKSVSSGATTDPWGGTVGGFGGWVRSILGGSLGGQILTGIYDDVKDLINPEDLGFPVPGGTDEDEEKETPEDRFIQLLGTTQDNLAVDSDLFGTADITADDDTTVGGDTTKDITNLLGGTIAQLDTTPVVDTTPGGTATGDDITKKITTLLGGTIAQLDNTGTPQTVTTEVGGGGTIVEPPPPVVIDPGGPPPIIVDPEEPVEPPLIVDPGGYVDPENPPPIVVDPGGYVDPENPPPIVVDPGGVVDPESSGGGGAVGGSDGMFEGAMRGLSYMPQVLPGVRQPPRLDAMGSLNMLIDGLLTGRRA